jgi:hypothetical protein
MGFDYFFGVSSGWMRDIAALQSVQRELTKFRLDWASRILLAGSPQASGDQEDMIERQIALISDFAATVGMIVESETADWLTEFRSSLKHLHDRAGAQRAGK